MKITVEIKKEELIKMVHDLIELKLSGSVDKKLITIETRSQQNYKSEWEQADFRARYEGDLK